MRLIMLLGILCPWVVWGSVYPVQQQAVPGGVAVVDLGAASEMPEAYFLSHRVAVAQDPKTHHWMAVVGLPLSLSAGQTQLQLKTGDKLVRTLAFEVKEKKYPTQSIHIKNKQQVNPDTQNLARIEKEAKQLASVLVQWQAQEPSWQLQYPLKAPLSGVFGSQRIVNGQPRAAHKGIDLAGHRGTPVHAAASGTVVGVWRYFFTGNTVVIDHGQGFKTLYCHLDQVQVVLNQKVVTGAPIGAVGSTGRATGPHLHFGVSLNNVRVDPLIFLAQE